MKILLNDIGTNDFIHNQKIVSGAVSPWSVAMYLHALLGEAEKTLGSPLKLRDFSFVLHSYVTSPGMKSEPYDSNRKGFGYKDISLADISNSPGLKHDTPASLKLSIFFNVDEGNQNSQLALDAIKDAFYIIRLFGGSYDMETMTRDISQTLISVDSNDNALALMRQHGGFLCHGLSPEETGEDSSSVTDTLLLCTMYSKDDKINKKKTVEKSKGHKLPENTYSKQGYVRAVMTGLASISGKPVARHGSRGGHEHVFAEPVIRLVLWMPIKNITALTEQDVWVYKVNETKTIFLVMNKK